MNEYKHGLRDGIPIALGYFSVSFAFGIMAAEAGLEVWEAALVSLMNVTSAGQFAGVTVMAALGSYIEMALTQLVINLRYSLMAISLSQKADGKFRGIWRALLGFGITDEVFAAAAGKDGEVSRSYFAGIISLPIISWTAGTLCGAVLGNVMPEFITNALGVALYGMFIAIVIPKAKESRKILAAVIMSAVISLMVKYIPWFSGISSGFAIIICAVAASAVCALIFGGKENEG
ncbi:MAG: AzlC family ABC transporter permease [Clostridiales bacterium]|nr:AzlC family ABC transporter permease [Clostridiales bacterium]